VTTDGGTDDVVQTRRNRDGAGDARLAYGFRLVPRENYRRYSVLVAVPLIAVGAYVLMSMKLGVLETQTDATVFGLRYVDWLLTTPLHVLYLGLLAGATNRSIWQSLVLMAATILFGFAGAMVASPLKWAGFAAGGLAFVGVVYITATSFERAARETGTLALLRKLRAFVVVLWLIYPAIWVLARSASA